MTAVATVYQFIVFKTQKPHVALFKVVKRIFKMACGHCGGDNHNRRTCPHNPDNPNKRSNNTSEESEPIVQRMRLSGIDEKISNLKKSSVDSGEMGKNINNKLDVILNFYKNK